ncbi:MAG: SpoIVB peptidase [Lachnospiraceae bacterium]|nr:SpoIVB peptidase [Lachnospiraceae bacterium]
MTRLQKYRLLVMGLFLISLSGLVVCGYVYLKDQVPDMIFVEEGEKIPAIFQEPYCSLISEEAVEAGSRDASDIPGDALHLSGNCAASGSGAVKCSLLGMIPLKTVEVERTSRQKVYAGGFPVGIYLETEGILVIGTGEVEGMDGQTYEPAEHIVESGDYIISADGRMLEDKEELVECINASGGQKISLEVLRDGEELELEVTPVQAANMEYKAGIWVRNDAQGVGTLTYTDESGNFGALGHGISDVDTSTLLSLKKGSLYEADVAFVTKGEKGKPGELAGIIHYRDSALLGTISENRTTGIYGTTDNNEQMESGQEYEIGYKQEIEKGPATILCSIDGTKKEYEINIESIDLNKKEINKGMVIRVTDPELLEKTGGIVQGMSGSPIIQNGRIVGAVTHVFVNDPTKGYGIFIENMLEH